MSLFKQILESRGARIAGLIGLLAAIAKLFDYAFPEIVRWVAITSLVLVGLYFIIIILQALVRNFFSKLDQRFAKQLAPVAESVSDFEDAVSALESRVNQQLAAVVPKVDDILRKLESWSSQIPVDQLELKQADEQVYVWLAERYGWAHGALSVECTIEEDGSASIRRRVQVEAYSEISQLDTFLLIPESSPDGEEERIIEPERVRSLTPGRDISSRRPSEPARELSMILLAIYPPLQDGESLMYELEEHTSPGLYAINPGEEELSQRKTPYDYFGWHISSPTRRLSLKVYFPAGFKPYFYETEVRYTIVATGLASEGRQQKEEDRLEKPSLVGPEANRYVLKLDVDHPMTGFVYIIRWWPDFLRPELKDGQPSDLTAIITEHERRLVKMLGTHERNLEYLEETNVKYGIRVPLDVLHSIEHEQAEITRLRQKLAELGKRIR